MDTLWTEKFRPSKFDEIKGQQLIVNRVRAFVENKNMPHLMFAGSAGTGKTTLSLVIVKELFGETWRENVLELNASDERGIDVIRNKVKNFARTKALGDVPFKIIYLDESDALTREAQQALRRTMENYTKTARFILSCNYSSKIIDPIQSRCAVFHFRPLPKEDIMKLIEHITSSEGLEMDEEAKEALFIISHGDCRRVSNILQSTAVISRNITKETIFEMASMAEPTELKDVLELAIENKFMDARKKLLDVMLKRGLSGLDMIKQIQKIIWDTDLPDKVKVAVIAQCGEAEFRMSEGADEFVQLEAFLAYVAMQKNT